MKRLGELGVNRNVMYPLKELILYTTYFDIQNSALCPQHACVYVLRIIQTTSSSLFPSGVNAHVL